MRRGVNTYKPRVTPASTVWMMTAGNIHSLKLLDATTTAHFFNKSAAYGGGASLIQSPVSDSYATTPFLMYTSYTQFSTDVSNGSITYPYQWVMYDPEQWSSTPVAEQQDPLNSMTSFGNLAHDHGMKVIMAPGRSLYNVTGSSVPKLTGETADQWYVRVGVASVAAAVCDIHVLQDEGNTSNIPEYVSLFNAVKSQAFAANPSVKVYSEVSTDNGTADQMVAAAQSVSADGFYVACPSAVPTALQFFQTINTLGY